MGPTKNILAVYAGQDKDVLQYLLPHLRPLERDFDIAIWSDDAINGGQPWKPRFATRSGHADIFLLLLSHNFIHSELIGQDEFKMVIDRHKEGRAIVIPILLDDRLWNVESIFEGHNLNFRELQVFHKDERPTGDWDPFDKTFTQVAYFIRGLLTSSTKKSAPGEPANKGGKKIPDTKEEGQIAIGLFEEREVNDNAGREGKRKKEAEAKKRAEENIKLGEGAEAKETIRKEKRLRQKAEIQKRIEKEKDLKEKAKKDKKIQEGAGAKRTVQEEMPGNQLAKAQMAVEEKGRGETAKPQRGAEREKRPGETAAAQKRTTKKNGLSGYNHQFKTAQTVGAKRTVQEEGRGNEGTRAQLALGEKGHGETAKYQRGTEGEKGPGETVAALRRATKKNGLAGYNHQFETAKTVAAKRTGQEEGRGNEGARAQMPVGEKVHGETAKSQRGTEGEKGPGEAVAALKRAMKKYRFAVQDYQVKIAAATDRFFKEAKKNMGTNKKRSVRSGFLIAALVIFGTLIYVFTGDPEKRSTALSGIEEAGVDSNAVADTKTDPENRAAAILKLGIGDSYKGGIVFDIGPSNKKGKIAYMDDQGPMTWNNAMTVHKQLGEGWRLPTLDELRLIYKNIGQGADNRGEFADELYWSATPFDDYQARLLRFRDGNASYHFNSAGTFRKFRVRAVQDFKR